MKPFDRWISKFVFTIWMFTLPQIHFIDNLIKQMMILSLAQEIFLVVYYFYLFVMEC